MGVMDWLGRADKEMRWGPQYKQRMAFNAQQQQLMLKKIMMAIAVQKSQISANKMLGFQRGTGALGDLTDIGREGEGEEFAFPPELMNLLGPEAQAMGRSSVETGRQRGLEEFEMGMEGEEALTGQREARSNLSIARMMELGIRLPQRMELDEARTGYYGAAADSRRASAGRSRGLTAKAKRDSIAKQVMDVLKEVGIQEGNVAQEGLRAPRSLFSEEMRPAVERAINRMDFFRNLIGQEWDEGEDFSGGIGAYDGIMDAGPAPGEDWDPDWEPSPDGLEGEYADDEGLLRQLMERLGTIGMGGQ